MNEPRRLLAVAAGFGRVGYAFFIDGVLCDWSVSRTAGTNPARATARAEAWFKKLRPEIVVTERMGSHCRKGTRARAVIRAVADAAAKAQLYDVSVSRRRSYANKHAEAASLAERFPELAPSLPRKRRPWDAEPRNMIYFEALALAVAVLDGTAVAGKATPSRTDDGGAAGP